MKSNRKILLLNPYYSNSKRTAANMRFEKLFENLHLVTDQCTLVSSCTENPSWLKVKKTNLILFQYSGSFFKRFIFYIYITLFLLVNKFDIIFSEFNPLPLTALLSKNVWLQIHHIEGKNISRRGNLKELFFRFYLRLYYLISSFIDNYKIMTVSQQSTNDIINLGIIRPKNADFVYNGVEANLLRQYINFNLDISYYYYDVIYGGNFSPRKNVEMLIEALSKIEKPLNVLLIGRDLGTKKRVHDKVLHECKQHRFSFKQNLSNEELLECYSKSALFVTASLHEGFGMPVVESACLGIPVICSDLPVFRELVPNAKFISANDTDNLSNLIIRCLDEFSSLKEDCLSISDQYLARYDWSLHSNQFINRIFSS